MDIARDAPAPHLRNKLERLAQLVVAPTLADDCSVCVHITQGHQIMPILQTPQPVKQFRCPASPMRLVSKQSIMDVRLS